MKNDGRVPGSDERIRSAAEWLDVLSAELDREFQALVREVTAIRETHERVRCRMENLLLRLQTRSITTSDPADVARDTRAFLNCYREFREAVTLAIQELNDRRAGRTVRRVCSDPSLN